MLRDIVTVLAPDGTILFQSQGFERLTGVEVRGKMLAATAGNTYIPTTLSKLGAHWMRPSKTGAGRFECRVRRRDGTWLECEMNGRRIVDLNGHAAAVFNARDISERKAAERTILDTQAQLRSRLEQQRAVADFGQQALRATEIEPLLDEAVNVRCQHFECRVRPCC